MFSNLNLKHLLLGIIFTLSISLPSFATDLTVSYIDIVQGHSKLIELQGGTNIMIDKKNNENTGKEVEDLRINLIEKNY